MPTKTKTASASSYTLEEIEKLLAAAPSPLAKLRVPFADEHIELRPQPRTKEDSTKAKAPCREGTSASVDGLYCGGYHVPSFHLSFVGHAALTERLLEADERWTWEPMARDEFGAPLLDKMGGLWINLIVDGASKPGYGDAVGKTMSTTAMKEIIGDALRNAGMRFGMALQLWSKVDLSQGKDARGEYENQSDPVVATGRRTQQKAVEAAPVPDQGIDNPDFDDDTTGARPKRSQSAWPPEGVDTKSRFIMSAAQAETAADVLIVWKAARNEFGPDETLSDAQRAILKAIEFRGGELRASEAAAVDPKGAASASTRDAVRAGFEGQ